MNIFTEKIFERFIFMEVNLRELYINLRGFLVGSPNNYNYESGDFKAQINVLYQKLVELYQDNDLGSWNNLEEFKRRIRGDFYGQRDIYKYIKEGIEAFVYYMEHNASLTPKNKKSLLTEFDAVSIVCGPGLINNLFSLSQRVSMQDSVSAWLSKYRFEIVERLAEAICAKKNIEEGMEIHLLPILVNYANNQKPSWNILTAKHMVDNFVTDVPLEAEDIINFHHDFLAKYKLTRIINYLAETVKAELSVAARELRLKDDGVIITIPAEGKGYTDFFSRTQSSLAAIGITDGYYDQLLILNLETNESYVDKNRIRFLVFEYMQNNGYFEADSENTAVKTSIDLLRDLMCLEDGVAKNGDQLLENITRVFQALVKLNSENYELVFSFVSFSLKTFLENLTQQISAGNYSSIESIKNGLIGLLTTLDNQTSVNIFKKVMVAISGSVNKNMLACVENIFTSFNVSEIENKRPVFTDSLITFAKSDSEKERNIAAEVFVSMLKSPFEPVQNFVEMKLAGSSSKNELDTITKIFKWMLESSEKKIGIIFVSMIYKMVTDGSVEGKGLAKNMLIEFFSSNNKKQAWVAGQVFDKLIVISNGQNICIEVFKMMAVSSEANQRETAATLFQRMVRRTHVFWNDNLIISIFVTMIESGNENELDTVEKILEKMLNTYEQCIKERINKIQSQFKNQYTVSNKLEAITEEDGQYFISELLKIAQRRKSLCEQENTVATMEMIGNIDEKKYKIMSLYFSDNNVILILIEMFVLQIKNTTSTWSIEKKLDALAQSDNEYQRYIASKVLLMIFEPKIEIFQYKDSPVLSNTKIKFPSNEEQEIAKKKLEDWSRSSNKNQQDTAIKTIEMMIFIGWSNQNQMMITNVLAMIMKSDDLISQGVVSAFVCMFESPNKPVRDMAEKQLIEWFKSGDENQQNAAERVLIAMSKSDGPSQREMVSNLFIRMVGLSSGQRNPIIIRWFVEMVESRNENELNTIKKMLEMMFDSDYRRAVFVFEKMLELQNENADEFVEKILSMFAESDIGNYQDAVADVIARLSCCHDEKTQLFIENNLITMIKSDNKNQQKVAQESFEKMMNDKDSRNVAIEMLVRMLSSSDQVVQEFVDVRLAKFFEEKCQVAAKVLITMIRSSDKNQKNTVDKVLELMFEFSRFQYSGAINTMTKMMLVSGLRSSTFHRRAQTEKKLNEFVQSYKQRRINEKNNSGFFFLRDEITNLENNNTQSVLP